jgi:hypothetical protein
VSVWPARSKPDAKGQEVEGGSNLGGGLTFVPDRRGKWNVLIVATDTDAKK